MSDTIILPETKRLTWADHFSTWLVLIYLLAALICMVAAPILAVRWWQQPFIGALVESPLVLNTSNPTTPGNWAIRQYGLKYGYQIVSISGKPIRTMQEYLDTLASYQIGDEIELVLRSLEGDLETYPIRLQEFPVEDRVAYFVIPYVVAVVYLLSALYIFGLRRRDATGKTFAIFTASVAIMTAGILDISSTNRLVYLWTFAVMVAGGSVLNMSLVFPEEERIFNRMPYLRWLVYLPSLVFYALAIPTLFNYADALAYSRAWRNGYILAGISILVLFGFLLYRLLRSESPIVKEQSKLILSGSLVSFLPIGAWFFMNSINPTLGFKPWLMLFIIVFPLVVAYTIARYRLMQADYIMSQTIFFSLLTLIAAIGYALLVSGLTLFFGGAFNATDPYLIGILVFFLAFVFSPLRERIQEMINRVFSRGQGIYRERLQAFSHSLTEALDLDSILKVLHQYVWDNLYPFQLHIFIHDPLSDQYVSTADSSGRATSDLRFAQSSALVQVLGQQRSAFFLSDPKSLPVRLQPEQTRMRLLGAQVYVPLPGRQKLTGWIALSARRSGEPYTQRDLNYLEALCDQAALAIERAQVVVDLERRIHEMNVLTRISQGVNVTVQFDDILELIYAQTYQVILTIDFWISLQDPYSNSIYHVFYLENDDRMRERESEPIPLGQGLEREILRSRRVLITDDYERECRSRGTLPALKGLFSWIGVPLNTGAETIGLLSLGSRDPSVLYTQEQANLLQAIADQAAGAIVKSRLLDEAERRTRQLTTLNDVARSMSSTLELKPLLNQILNSAVEILNCEAGSLLLVDQETGEMVFEVAVGPVAGNLVGQRLPANTGLVGKAVETRQPVIVNDVRRTKEWYREQDDVTGFTTNDLLVVPMIYKDSVIGVIEVLNRRDGLPFTPDDQELLTAFTSQAAVAIENARLYTLTDQSLAERVEELSVLQRIDRELNASLDVTRAMRITLDWAMRQSRANAGLVGIVEENGLLVMASQGYAQELMASQDSPQLMELPTIQEAIASGHVQTVRLEPSSNGGSQKSIMDQASSQIVVPIRRESDVIGLMLLESRSSETTPEEVLAFLSRLSDHASIAIANARLYTEVQAANQAKSDFVSFVSHELKTPMTSIRGFTDLLAAGVVGPVNENQANFLTTIRSNVDRMATLVTDLADVSRIEAGRLRLDFSTVPVTEIVDEVVRSLRNQVSEKQQTLEVNVPDDLPMMWGDRTRLIQVLTNLVSNAYKYTPPEGHIQITATLETSQRQESSPQVIHLAVKDSGFGISEENQKKIFQKFFRADDQKVRDAPGTGLGLNITKQLVELQGGRIWFESEFREGTTFHFTIPIAEMV